ncbi:MAG: PDZ domain-containing protein, partial [Planctomycetota bacterium]
MNECLPAVRRLASAALTGAVLSTISFAQPLTAGGDNPADAQRGERRPHAGMMRFPHVSATHIVFAYADDLWIVPRGGGQAFPLASPPGGEAFPRFSPDGQTVAFVGNYDGNRDIYTISINGGMPYRVTHHPAAEVLCGWTPSGRLLFFATYEGLGRQSQLFTVADRGGLPEKLPVPYGATGAISPDGTWLAYTPHTNDARTWKRYRGGMATDIWLFNLRDNTSRRVTEWEGNDSQPMWHADKLYYISDAGPSHRTNIWVYDPRTNQREQVTTFDEFDVKWPAIGPGPSGEGEIVFQYGANLYLLDLRARKSRPVEITVPGDRPAVRPQLVDVAGRIDSWDISPSGKRAVFEARGDIWTAPAEKGSARSLTRTSGAAERSPAWSPDGRWIAYFCDQTGEYELYLRQSDGRGQSQQLTYSSDRPDPKVGGATEGKPGDKPREPGENKLAAVFRYNLVWSPDSKYILFTDKTGTMYLHTVAQTAKPAADKKKDDKTAEHEDKPATQAADVEDTAQPAATTEPAATAPAETQPVRRGVAPVGETLVIDTDPWARQPQMSWSHDSNWLAYTRTCENQQSAIWLYALITGEKHQVTSGMFSDSWPTFDRKGEYLFFASNRHFANPTYEDIGSSFVYTGTDVLVVAPLRTEVASPWLPKSDEESWGGESEDEAKEKEEGENKGKESDKPAPGGGEERRPRRRHPGAADVLTAQRDPQEDSDTQPASAPATAPADKDKDKDEDTKKKADKTDKPLEIDLAGFEQRALQVPVDPGAFFGLSVAHDGKLLYVRGAGRRRGGGGTALKLFDLKDEDREEKTVLENAGNYAISANGKKLLVAQGGRYAVIDPAPGQKASKSVPLDAMTVEINPREEWRQLFLEAWRLQRDFFYVPNMHGVDWAGLRDRYLRMLDDCVSREDVGHVIRELISELNVGHAYYFGGGEAGREPSVSVGLLGADFELAPGDGADQPAAYRIRRILIGGPWDLDARGPLSQPGVNIRAGDYLLAVNGVPVDARKDPWAAFQGLAGKTVMLTVSDKPVLDPNAPLKTAAAEKKDEKKEGETADSADARAKKNAERFTGQRDVVIRLLSGDGDLRYRDWVERNRRYVAEKTDGKVGYIHVPDTGVNGQNELFRQFYGQRDKAALIIDERWNGGGQIPHRFIELLNRPVVNYWHRRDGKAAPSPADAHFGPKCMLINGLAGSGGDAFPYYFRKAGLGKLIGMRTWGGLVGISGNPRLIDGTMV